jgi:hypothetical protein
LISIPTPVGEGTPGGALLSSSLRSTIQLEELPRTNRDRQPDGDALHQQAGGQGQISTRRHEEDLDFRPNQRTPHLGGVHQHPRQQVGGSPIQGVQQPQHRVGSARFDLRVPSPSVGSSGHRLLRGDGKSPTPEVHGLAARPLLDSNGFLREDCASPEATLLLPALQLGAPPSRQVGEGEDDGVGGSTSVAITPVLAHHAEHVGPMPPDPPERPLDSPEGIVPEGRVPPVPDDRLSAIRREWGPGAFSDAAWQFRFEYFDKNSPQGDSSTMRRYQRYFQLYLQFLIAGIGNAAQFSAPSLVSAADWLKEQGLLTCSSFDGFFTAFNEIHLLRFGTKLSDLDPIKGSRKSAKKKVVPRRPPATTPHYPDPATVVLGWSPNPTFWSMVRLRQRAVFSVHADIIGRGGEASKLVRWGLKFDKRGFSGFLWSIKTAKGVMTPCSARHCCQHFKAGRCSPCLLLEILSREKRDGVQVENHIDCSPILVDGIPLFTCGVFLCSQKTRLTGRFRSLGSQRIAKLIVHSFTEGRIDKHWTAHDLRGIVASKLVNMGCPEQTVTLRARFSLETFRTHYYKYVQYAEKSDSIARLEVEHIIRIKGTVLS